MIESSDSKLPIFVWNITDLDDRPFYMNIDFQDGSHPDVAILLPDIVNGKEDLSILRGALRDERPNVEITIIGRPNDTTFDVILILWIIKQHNNWTFDIKILADLTIFHKK